MPSVIRLLPKRKVERNLVPYKQVLSYVFQRWFVYTLRTSFLLVLCLSGIGHIFLPHTTFWQLLFALSFSSLIALFLYKLEMQFEFVPQLTAAKDFIKIWQSKRLYLSLFAYVTTSLGYFYTICPKWLVKYCKHEVSNLRGNPRGIPEGLPLHLRGNWLEINSNYVYIELFFLSLGVLNGFYFILSRGFIVKHEGSDVGSVSFNRMFSRLQLKNQLRNAAFLALGMPILYFVGTHSLYKYTFVSNSATDVLSGLSLKVMFYPLYCVPLVLVWEMTHAILRAYFCSGPIFKRQAFTDLAAGDKNGCLLDGLSSNLSSISGFYAWYELLFIAEHENQRRKTLYNDIDNDLVVWESIHKEFLNVIDEQLKSLEPKQPKKQENKPIPEQLVPVKPINSAQSVLLSTGSNEDQNPQRIKFASNSDSLYHAPSALEKKLSLLTKKLEGDSTAKTQRARHKLHKLLLTLTKFVRENELRFYKTGLGMLFVPTCSRKLNFEIQHKQTTAFALNAVAQLVVKSIEEDQYGYVQGTVGDILNSMDKLALKLESIIASPLNVKNIEPEISDEDLLPATILLKQVNLAFTLVANAFEPYFDNININTQARKRADHVDELEIADSAWIQ